MRCRGSFIWRSLLLGGGRGEGRFSVPLAPLATALVRGAAAAIGPRFPINHVAGRCKEKELRRYRQLLGASVANGGDAPVSKELDICDIVGQVRVAGPWYTVVREGFRTKKEVENELQGRQRHALKGHVG